jgi:hypothetical protein
MLAGLGPVIAALTGLALLRRHPRAIPRPGGRLSYG